MNHDAATTATGNMSNLPSKQNTKKTKIIRPQHPVPTKGSLQYEHFYKHATNYKSDRTQYCDLPRPYRQHKPPSNKGKRNKNMVLHTSELKRSRKGRKQILDKSTPTRVPLDKYRKLVPRQGQDTRVIRDSNNRKIEVINKAIVTRDKVKGYTRAEQPKLQQHRCKCSSQVIKARKKGERCKGECGRRQGGVYLMVCKRQRNVKLPRQSGRNGKCNKRRGWRRRKFYVGESSDILHRFHDHMQEAFAVYRRTGEQPQKLEEEIRTMGEGSIKDWCLVLLEEIPQLEGESEKTWRNRRRDAERKWQCIFNSKWPNGFNEHQCEPQMFRQWRTERQWRPRKRKGDIVEGAQSTTKQRTQVELMEVEDYVNEVMAFTTMTENGTVTAGIPVEHLSTMVMDEGSAATAATTVATAMAATATATVGLLKAMHSHVVAKTFTQDMLEQWGTQALYRVLQMATTDVHLPWSKRDKAVMIQQLQRQIRARRAELPRKQRREESSIIMAPYTGVRAEQWKLNSILNDSTAQATFPDAIRLALGHPKVQWSYERKIGWKLTTDKRHLASFDFDDPSRDPQCICNNTWWKQFKCTDGHVCTTNLDCIQDAKLKALYEKGYSFRSAPEAGDMTTPAEDASNIRRAIEEYISKVTDVLGLNKVELLEWKIKVTALIEQQEAKMADVKSDPRQYVNWKQCAHAAKALSENFTSLASDKAANTPTIKCKAKLIKQAREELLSTATYERHKQEPMEHILKRHVAFVDRRFKMAPQQPQARVPSLGAVVKNHKQQANRWLARSYETSLTALSKWIHKALKACMVTSEKLWIDMLHYWHIHTAGSWIINDHQRVRQNLNLMNENGITPHLGSLQSFDFTSMYNSLEHKMIIELMHEYIDLVFTHELEMDSKHKFLLIRGRYTQWTNQKTQYKRAKSCQCFSAKELKECISFLVNNLFLLAGGAMFKQRIGLPMGANAAPMLANLTLFMLEFKYMKKLTANVTSVGDGNWALLKQLSFCTRYIDDLQNYCVPPDVFEGIMLEIYSSNNDTDTGLVATNETCNNGNRANYLDMAFWYSHKHKRMVCKLYDKRVALMEKGLKFDKFPHRDSCLANSCKYGIITSQCARFLVTCSESKYWLQAATDMYQELIKKGYNVKLVQKHFSKFVKKHRQTLKLKPTAVQDNAEMRRKSTINRSIFKKLDAQKAKEAAATTTATVAAAAAAIATAATSPNTATAVAAIPTPKRLTKKQSKGITKTTIRKLARSGGLKYVLTPDMIALSQFPYMKGKRKFGKVTRYSIQHSKGHASWEMMESIPDGVKQVLNNTTQYKIIWPHGKKAWALADQIPRLPCPGIVLPTAQGLKATQRQQIAKNKARAMQQRINKHIARMRIAKEQAKIATAKAWKSTFTSQPTLTPAQQAERAKRIQEEFDQYRLRTAPKRVWTDHRKAQQQQMQQAAFNDRLSRVILPTNPNELEQALFDGNRGFHSAATEGAFAGLQLKY